jgi:hypothetical protein
MGLEEPELLTQVKTPFSNCERIIHGTLYKLQLAIWVEKYPASPFRAAARCQGKGLDPWAITSGGDSESRSEASHLSTVRATVTLRSGSGLVVASDGYSVVIVLISLVWAGASSR